MKTLKILIFTIIILVLFMSGCDTKVDNPSSSSSSSAGDNTPPQIISMRPLNNQSNVDINYADLMIVFDKEMQSGTSMTANLPFVSITKWDTSKKSLYIIFQEQLLSNTKYIITLNPTGYAYNFKDISGNLLAADTVFSFTTTGSSTNQPVISSLSIANGSTGVDKATTSLDITFDQDMQNASSFSFSPSSISCSYSWTSTKILKISFNQALSANTTYTLKLNVTGYGQGIRNTSNVRLKEDTIISFTTGL